MSAVTAALQLLQLSPGASRKQIRAAYKRLALQLHPDKQQQQQQHLSPAAAAAPLPPPPPQAQSSTGDAAGDATPTSFAMLSAAYSLLIQGSVQQQCDDEQQQQWPAFETAFAEGSLFSEQLVDEAVLTEGVSPLDIHALCVGGSCCCQCGGRPNLLHCVARCAVAERFRSTEGVRTPRGPFTRRRCPASVCADMHCRHELCQAAAAGQLAVHLAAHPPMLADEQLWRQLHNRLGLKQRARHMLRHQQQQQQHGVGLGELLSDLLLRPTGPLLVPDTDSDSESEADGAAALHSEQGCTAKQAAPARIAAQPPQQQQHQQHHQLAVAVRQQGQQQHSQDSQQPSDSRQRLRHGWGFYWLWLRRALLARAVVSLVTSGLRAQMAEHLFPERLEFH
jgi:hypothetical protein